MMEDLGTGRSLSTRSSVETTVAQKAGLRQIKIQKEGPVVIMPLDSSSHSAYCLAYYVKYIHKPENTVHVCYVAEDFFRKVESKTCSETEETPVERKGCLASLKRLFDFKPQMTIMDTMGPSPGMLNELERKDKINRTLVKSEAKDVFSSNEVRFWDFKTITGEDPWTAIVNYSEEKRGNIIILGSRGLSKMKRNIFGSVSDKVLHRSSIPVLVVKRPHWAPVDVAAGISAID